MKIEIKVYRDIMEVNDAWAEKSRRLLSAEKVVMVNLIGSPGCGKTALLEATSGHLQKKNIRFAVLEGDVETTRDAERLHQARILVFQLITGGGCHLSAQMVHQALVDLPLKELDLVIVENVGNLVCPAEFDIGEKGKIAALSVTEGEDKPIKYPALFQQAKACVITKTDLLPHLPFQMEACLQYVRQVNPAVPVFKLSAWKNAGIIEWCNWLVELCKNEKKNSNKN